MELPYDSLFLELLDVLHSWHILNQVFGFLWLFSLNSYGFINFYHLWWGFLIHKSPIYIGTIVHIYSLWKFITFQYCFYRIRLQCTQECRKPFHIGISNSLAVHPESGSLDHMVFPCFEEVPYCFFSMCGPFCNQSIRMV